MPVRTVGLARDWRRWVSGWQTGHRRGRLYASAIEVPAATVRPSSRDSIGAKGMSCRGTDAIAAAGAARREGKRLGEAVVVGHAFGVRPGKDRFRNRGLEVLSEPVKYDRPESCARLEGVYIRVCAGVRGCGQRRGLFDNGKRLQAHWEPPPLHTCAITYAVLSMASRVVMRNKYALRRTDRP
jgi:hypothetical protein